MIYLESYVGDEIDGAGGRRGVRARHLPELVSGEQARPVIRDPGDPLVPAKFRLRGMHALPEDLRRAPEIFVSNAGGLENETPHGNAAGSDGINRCRGRGWHQDPGDLPCHGPESNTARDSCQDIPPRGDPGTQETPKRE